MPVVWLPEKTIAGQAKALPAIVAAKVKTRNKALSDFIAPPGTTFDDTPPLITLASGKDQDRSEIP